MFVLTALAADVPATPARVVYVTTSGGGEYVVLGAVPGTLNTWFVRGDRTDALGIVTVTSRQMWQQKLRVRFFMARDMGDVAGTLAFDGDSFGGFAWADTMANVGLLTR